ncbi:hypothetical protein PISL3812_02820 [Talaromyces islandicus]|uniref:BZIP domain-containing protein n=1 Tax=Talaromyces islandicus TaxID=28573 RepID=A0A0U1LQZ3_TALIS|nr:hypothetical protein PISL3812_02820 [Talaromyces islandicus]
MSSQHNNEKLNRLARVRENQRRSRARKQQYIDELEQKVAACDARAQQQDIEHRIALQKLEAENSNLRSLLNRVGVDSGYLETYLKQCSVPEASGKLAIPALTKPSPQSSSSQHSPAGPDTPTQYQPSLLAVREPESCCSSGSSCTPVANPGLAYPTPEQPKTLPPMPPMASVATAAMAATQRTDVGDEFPTADKGLRLPPISSICDCGPGSSTLWPNDGNSLNSTLCGIAEDLINRYNIQGVDINFIKQRLWPGFRNSGPEGCRVENSVLFEVLDELSGNIPS